MHSLSYDLISVISSVAIMSTVFLILYRIEKQDYLLDWFLAYLLFAFSFIENLTTRLGISNSFFPEFSTFCEVMSGIFMFFGAYRFSYGNLLPKKFKLLSAAVLAVFIILFVTVSRNVQMIVLHIFVGTIQIYSGLILLNKVRSISGRIAGGAITLWGMHRYTFILTLFLPEIIQIRYHATFILAITTSIGVIMMHFESLKEELSRMDKIIKQATLSSRDIIYNFRLRPDLTVKYVSPSIENILGMKPEDVIDKGISLNVSFKTAFLERMREHIYSAERSSSYSEVFDLKTADGRDVKLDMNTTILYGVDNKPESAIGIARDVTEQSNAFETLADSKQWYESIFKSSGIMVMVVDSAEMAVTDCNKSIAEYYCRTMNEMTGMHMREFFVDRKEYGEYLRSIRKDAEHQTRQTLPDGSVMNVTLYTSVLTLKNKEFLYITVFDNNSSLMLAEELSKMKNLHKSILESLDEGVVGINVDGNVFFINDSALNQLGYHPEEILFKQHHEIIHYRNAAGMVNREDCDILIALNNQTSLRNHQDHFVKKNGALMPVKYNFSHMKEANGAGILVFHDITEELENERSLINSLKQNKLLLHELHHRIKNNFQVISSLLSLHADTLDDGNERQFLSEAVSKIHSMSLIHEMLYQNKNFAYIDARLYFEKLLSDLMTFSDYGAEGINITTDIEDLKIHLDEAVPCALIINELFTNSLKYAFKDSQAQDKTISLSFSQLNGERTLVFSDNGIGVDGESALESGETYGIMIVRSLAHQLKGKIEFGTSGGVTATVVYTPAKAPEEA
ncbi:MAG: PAS domain S-box protein [Deferribacterales bacterium]